MNRLIQVANTNRLGGVVGENAASLVSQSPSFSFESKMGVRQSEELVQQVSQTGDIDWLDKTKGKLICCYRSFLFIQSIVENLLLSDSYRLLHV